MSLIKQYDHQYGIDEDAFLLLAMRNDWELVSSGAAVLRVCKVPKSVWRFRIPEFEIGSYSKPQQTYFTDAPPPPRLPELLSGKLKPFCECCANRKAE